MDIIDTRTEINGVKVGVRVHDLEQWDDPIEGMPYTAHQSYLTDRGYGSRRVGVGATPEQALAIGLLNAARYPVDWDIPRADTIPDQSSIGEA